MQAGQHQPKRVAVGGGDLDASPPGSR